MADDGSRDSFYSAVSDFFKDSDTNVDYQKKIDNISSWVDEQKKKGKEDHIREIGEALKTTVEALKKFKTGDPYDITCGTLDIIASFATVAGGPYGVAVAAFCGIVGAIVSANKPEKPSVVEQLANIVHSELVKFKSILQEQDLSGLQGRVRRQLSQLQEMAPEDKLDDEDLWNQFDHFMGELRPRISSPLPFKYDNNLIADPEMADFVKALETYCRAYTCFMALLTVAKVKCEELGRRSEIETINRHIYIQRNIAKEKMLFLSEEKYLTFLGRLPSEGGSLTKILLLSRNPTAKRLIESTRRELGLSAMPDSVAVEQMAEKVSRQYVKLKLPFEVPQDRMVVQFYNETDFPVRIVSGTVGSPQRYLKFTEDIEPRRHYSHDIENWSGSFSYGGYMKIAYNGNLSPKKSEDPNETGVGIIEFALSRPFYNPWGDSGTNNIQDKSDGDRTKGQDTYDKMTSGEDKIIYWKKGGKHYLAECENRKHIANKIKLVSSAKTWRFIIQEFDPDKDVDEKWALLCQLEQVKVVDVVNQLL